MKFIKKHKQIHDSIHGFIQVSNIACAVIDTPEFQRLKLLHQLGTCHYVFPNASHTRFEHSIGVYYLAKKMMKSIKKNSNITQLNEWLGEYKEFDNHVIELVGIAGLCHDLGHGPFSHAFDDHLHRVHKTPDKYMVHEYRSCLILKHIIKKNLLLSTYFTDSDITFIQNLIYPQHDNTGFIYQIISNYLNGIDVDKFDYITRDSHNLGKNIGFDYTRLINNVMVVDNTVCYPEQMYYDVISLFQARYTLFKQIYTHKVSISVQYMISDIIKLVDDELKISESIYDVDKFCDVTDEYILSLVRFNKNKNKNFKKAYQILNRINTRNLYKLVHTIVSPSVPDLDILMLNDNGIIIHNMSIGYSNEKTNPLDNLYFYDHQKQIKKIKKTDVSLLIPSNYKENLCMIFVKDKSNKALIKEVKTIVQSRQHTQASLRLQ